MEKKLKISKQGLDLIKFYESLHDGNLSKIGLQPKECPAGFWTVGYGRMLKDLSGKPFSGADGYRRMIEMYPDFETITEQQACEMLDEDCDYFERVINRLQLDLKQNQFDALVSFVYNIGEGNFANSTVRKIIMNPDIAHKFTLVEAFLMWNKSKGDIKSGLIKRRRTEVNLFKSGKLILG